MALWCASLKNAILTIQVRLLYNIIILHFSPHISQSFIKVKWWVTLQSCNNVKLSRKRSKRKFVPLTIVLNMQVTYKRSNGEQPEAQELNILERNFLLMHYNILFGYNSGKFPLGYKQLLLLGWQNSFCQLMKIISIKKYQRL